MIKNLKILLRKSAAKNTLALKDTKDRLVVLKNLAKDRYIYSLIVSGEDVRMPTMSDLLTILSENQANESIDLQHKPSDTSFKKWALVSAVLDYYTQLQKNVDFKIAEKINDNKLVRELAPNQKEIYNIWLKKLYEGVRQNALSENAYLEAYEKGPGRGTSFEKLLERYRKDFMNQIWQKLK